MYQADIDSPEIGKALWRLKETADNIRRSPDLMITVIPKLPQLIKNNLDPIGMKCIISFLNDIRQFCRSFDFKDEIISQIFEPINYTNVNVRPFMYQIVEILAVKMKIEYPIIFQVLQDLSSDDFEIQNAAKNAAKEICLYVDEFVLDLSKTLSVPEIIEFIPYMTISSTSIRCAITIISQNLSIESEYFESFLKVLLDLSAKIEFFPLEPYKVLFKIIQDNAENEEFLKYCFKELRRASGLFIEPCLVELSSFALNCAFTNCAQIPALKLLSALNVTDPLLLSIIPKDPKTAVALINAFPHSVDSAVMAIRFLGEFADAFDNSKLCNKFFKAIQPLEHLIPYDTHEELGSSIIPGIIERGINQQKPIAAFLLNTPKDCFPCYIELISIDPSGLCTEMKVALTRICVLSGDTPSDELASDPSAAGLALFEVGEYEAAAAFLKKCSGKNFEHALYYFALGEVAFINRKFSDAVSCYLAAVNTFTYAGPNFSMQEFMSSIRLNVASLCVQAQMLAMMPTPTDLQSSVTGINLIYSDLKAFIKSSLYLSPEIDPVSASAAKAINDSVIELLNIISESKTFPEGYDALMNGITNFVPVPRAFIISEPLVDVCRCFLSNTDITVPRDEFSLVGIDVVGEIKNRSGRKLVFKLTANNNPPELAEVLKEGEFHAHMTVPLVKGFGNQYPMAIELSFRAHLEEDDDEYIIAHFARQITIRER